MFADLHDVFQEPNIVRNILHAAMESINDNVDLIKAGMKEKNIHKVYMGCHTLHGIGFIGHHKCLQIANVLTELLREKTNFQSIEMNENNIIELFQELYDQSDIFLIQINDELTNIENLNT